MVELSFTLNRKLLKFMFELAILYIIFNVAIDYKQTYTTRKMKLVVAITCLIGQHNPSVRIIDLVSHTTYVVCVNFIHT